MKNTYTKLELSPTFVNLNLRPSVTGGHFEAMPPSQNHCLSPSKVGKLSF